MSIWKVTLESDAVFQETRDYVVKIGTVNDDMTPRYLVIRKTSGVVEFHHEVGAIINEWIAHFEDKNNQPVTTTQLAAAVENGPGGPVWADLAGDDKVN